MKRWIRDVIYAVVFITLAVLLWIEAGTFEQQLINIELAKPTTYGRLWAGILGLLGVIQLVRALIKRPDEKLPKIFTVLALITLGSLILYVATVRFMGFTINTFLIMTILILSYTFAMGKIDTKNKKKMILQILLYVGIALVISICLRLLFVNLLGAKLPKGKILPF